MKAIHQVLVGATPGSSIWNEALAMRAALREWGYRSDVYVDEAHAALRRGTTHFAEYRPRPSDALIYHYSTASTLTERVLAAGRPTILMYHNVTPPHHVENANSYMAAQLRRAGDELHRLGRHVRLAITHSEFSLRDLVEAGFERIAAIPAVMPDTLFAVQPDPTVLSRFDDGGVNLLSVGRLVPNKKHGDAIRALCAYRRINPDARLLLIGAPDNAERYVAWLHDVAMSLGVGERVHFAGHVSDAALAAYYRLARVLVCLSEHEGFCIPLVEAMRFGVPIVAYASSAIPETLGGAGVLLRAKHYPILAEVIDLLHRDGALRAQIVARQHRRAAELDRSAVLPRLRTLIADALEDAA